MSRYILLGSFTDQGIRNFKDAPKRDERARQLIEEAGGKLQLYYTFGDYDFVAIVEMSSDEQMLKFLLQIGSLGNVRTKTLKAWTEFEFTEVLAQLQ